MNGRGSIIQRQNAASSVHGPRGLAMSSQQQYTNTNNLFILKDGGLPGNKGQGQRNNRYTDVQHDELNNSQERFSSGVNVTGGTNIQRNGNKSKLLMGILSSPQASNIRIGPDNNSFVLHYNKHQTHSHGNTAKKSPKNYTMSQSFSISRQQQVQQSANRTSENSRYGGSGVAAGKRSQDLAAAHKSHLKSIEQLAQNEMAEKLGRNNHRNNPGLMSADGQHHSMSDGIQHARSDNQRQTRTALGQFQMHSGIDGGNHNLSCQNNNYHWVGSQGKGGGIGLLQQQRRVQASQGAGLGSYQPQQPRILDRGDTQKSDDLLQLSQTSAMAKRQNQDHHSYYVQMLKVQHNGNKNTRQTTDRAVNQQKQGERIAPMPDHLSEKMLQRNPHGIMSKHSISDYNFYKGSGNGSRQTPNGRQGTSNNNRFANNSTHFQIYKNQNLQMQNSRQQQRESHMSSNNGQRMKYCGEIRKQSSTHDRPNKLTDVLPRTNSQATNNISYQGNILSGGKSMGAGGSANHQFSMTENLGQSGKVNDFTEFNELNQKAYPGNPGVLGRPLKHNQSTQQKNKQMTAGGETSQNNSTGQTLDSATTGQRAAATNGCQWWQNGNYLSFKGNIKQESDDRSSNTAINLAKIKNSTEKQESSKYSGASMANYQQNHVSDFMDGCGRGTLSLLSNKPLRVGSHCMQNLLLDQPIQSFQAPVKSVTNFQGIQTPQTNTESQSNGNQLRMIVNQQQSTVQSTIGLYGLQAASLEKRSSNNKQNESKISATQPTNTSSDDGKLLVNQTQTPLSKLYFSSAGQGAAAIGNNSAYINAATTATAASATTTSNFLSKPNMVYQDANNIETSSSNVGCTSSDPLSLSTRNKLKLSSARHARPPKGVIGNSASNKLLDASSRNKENGTPGIDDNKQAGAGKAERKQGKTTTTFGDTASKLSKNGKDSGSNDPKYHNQRIQQRRRLKNTQHSVDINKVRAQQEFLEHRTRLIQQQSQQQPSNNDEQNHTLNASKQNMQQQSTRKKRIGQRPQSSIPTGQLSKRKNRIDRNGKRTALVSQNKQISNRKCNELLDELEQVAQETESLKQTIDKQSKDYESSTVTIGLQRKSNSVLRSQQAPKLTLNKQQETTDNSTRVLPILPLPLPPRIDSTRKDATQISETDRQSKTNTFAKQVRNSTNVNGDQKIKISMGSAGKQKSASNLHSPDFRRRSTSSINQNSVVKLMAHTSNETLPVEAKQLMLNEQDEPKYLYDSTDAKQNNKNEEGQNDKSHARSHSSSSTQNKIKSTLEPSKSSPSLVKTKEETTQSNHVDIQLPQISAQSFLIYDCNSNQVLLSRKCQQKREVASITKMMTFYTVLKLIERYHAILHIYSYDLASLQQQESTSAVAEGNQQPNAATSLKKRDPNGSMQRGQKANETTAASAAQQNANSSTSSTSKNSTNIRGSFRQTGSVSGVGAVTLKGKVEEIGNGLGPQSKEHNHASFNRCLKLYSRISKKASKIPGTTAHLREGDILTIDQLLYGMMLPSGNDAAYALAEFFGKVLKENKYTTTSGNPEDNADLVRTTQIAFNNSFVMKSHSSPYIRCFLMEMNFFGQKLGLQNTVYDSPHGLNNKNNVSCAADVAKLIRECMIGSRPKRRKSNIGDALATDSVHQIIDDNSELGGASSTQHIETAKGRGWVQKVYRRIVGTKRHETNAIVPVELTPKEIKKQIKKKKTAKSIMDSEDDEHPQLDTAEKETPKEIEKEKDTEEKAHRQDEEEEKETEQDKIQETINGTVMPRIKIKTRRYRWENTNKLLNVEIDTWKKEAEKAQESAQKAQQHILTSETAQQQPAMITRSFGMTKVLPSERPAYTGGYVIGCKTGITSSAGPCFAGFYESEETGVQLAVIVLHSHTPDLRWHEIRQMVRWAHLCDRSKISRKRLRRKPTINHSSNQRNIERTKDNNQI